MSRKIASASTLFSTKEDQQFKEALKLYESKQYKKSIKLLEQNLKKNSSHVESLSLKGLVLYYLDELVSAKEYIEKAISKNPQNPVANHIVAIYYRNLGNYQEAAKWFKAAIDNGTTNNNILRELSIVQSQIRDYKGLVSSRLLYLDDQPGYRANWTSTAVAHHLNKDYKAAEKVLSRIETLIDGKLADSDLYEHSECLLYKNQIIGESGDFKKSLQNLEHIELNVFDKQSLLLLKAHYLMNLQREKEASLIYRQLIRRNPDNKDLYYLLEKSLKIESNDVETKLKLYNKLATFYPKADPVKFIPLQFLQQDDDVLKTKLSDYILSQLQKGVPSTFVNVKPLYKQIFKRELIEKIVLEFFNTNKALEYSPLTYCWTAYFLSQHFLYKRDLTNANKYIDIALEHTPTLVELYILKARILKHENKLVELAQKMDEGRLLDLQDRFINSKATKYYLRANMVDELADLISMFTKLDKELINGVKDLHLMQCCWFIVESAEAYYRLYKSTPDKEMSKNYKALSLKRFQAIDKIYQEFYNDQVDFHSYCMRKGTPRHYIKLLNWADNLYNDVTYNRVLQGLYKLYLLPESKTTSTELNEEEEEEIIKKKKKLTKQELKKKEEFIGKINSYTKDDDPIGLKLLDVEPISEFHKFLQKCNNDFYSTLYLNFKYFLKIEKYVIALQQINKIHKKNLDSKLIYSLLAELKLDIQDKDAKIAKLVDLSINKNFPQFNGVSLEEFKKICIDEISKLDNDDAFVIIEYINSIDGSNELINSKLNEIYKNNDPFEISKFQQLTI